MKQAKKTIRIMTKSIEAFFQQINDNLSNFFFLGALSFVDSKDDPIVVVVAG